MASLDPMSEYLRKYVNDVKTNAAKKHRESQEGKQLESFLHVLDEIAKKLLENHDETCCSKQIGRHFEFQCKFHEEYVIASYHRGVYAHLGMEQVEQFVTFMAAYELETFIDKNYETSAVASKFKSAITLIINYCITNFMDNIYVVDFNKRGTSTQESTNILQEDEEEEKKYDKSLSLGMPMHPQEEEHGEEEK